MGMAYLLLFGVFWLAREGARMVSVQREKDSFVVVVDPGHGGSDPERLEFIKRKRRISTCRLRKVKKKMKKVRIEVMTREKR